MRHRGNRHKIINDQRKPMCLKARKFKYGKKAALSAAHTSKNIEGIDLSIYKCPHCRTYHLTKQKRGTA